MNWSQEYQSKRMEPGQALEESRDQASGGGAAGPEPCPPPPQDPHHMNARAPGEGGMPRQGPGQGLQVQVLQPGPAQGTGLRPGDQGAHLPGLHEQQVVAASGHSVPGKEGRQAPEGHPPLPEFRPGPTCRLAGFVRSFHGQPGKIGFTGGQPGLKEKCVHGPIIDRLKEW